MEKQGLHIDFKVAKQSFESYLDEYDREDDKIQLKIVHTYCVVDAAEEIATRMHLREEDVQLAKIIGLLHDIGRFEQIKRFHSFEPGTMDHAMYGADLLFGPEQMIRRFVTDPSFDQLICVAIAKHSDFKLEGIEDERTLLHARLIRDADKLDNCRVKLEERVEVLLGGASAKEAGAQVYQNPWKNYATQFNWGLKNCPITTEWIWRIDADEFLEGNLGPAMKKALAECNNEVNGVYVRKRIDFMGKPLLHGGWYPSYHLKVWRRGHGECENRWMDEHIRIFSGTTITVEEGNQVDANLNDLTWWTEKHNGYATREMADMLMMEYGLDDRGKEVQAKFWGTEEQRKRWLKVKYIKAPLFLRPFINFNIRYILKGGFLDGKEGFIWHFLQGFWYRFLVDAKIYEIKKRFGWNDKRIKAFIKETYLDK